ncbi:MAG: efflux RND transporter periplasmic adaptor subunit [Bacteroidetes bacterium]|nr:MAG: efflux RND transporter periplasmic adaptor subunit [Bacteroidota bacterium]
MKKIISLILTALLFVACESNNKNVDKEEEHHHEDGGPEEVRLNKQQRDALNLKLGGFQMRNLTTVVKVNGQLEVSPDNKAEITTLIGGNVKAIKVFHGDKVRKGQVLALLEHPDFISLQESYAEFASSLEYLEQDYKRQKELFESNAGSNKDYQKAKADYFTAKARYQGLHSRLLLLNLSPEEVQKGKISNTIRLISPINGYVNEINVKIGSFVGPNDKLFEITNNSAIHADFMVYEKDVHLIEKGQTIHFTVANHPDVEFTAIIFAIGKEFAANTRAVHVHSNINESKEDLIPGMYITGHLHTDEKYTQTLPDDAIVYEGTKSYIFVLLDSDKESHNHEVEEEDHEDHGHEAEELSHEGHKHEAEEAEHEEHSEKMTFRMVEVMIGSKDDGYTEVKLIETLPKNTKIVLNAAYYLLADMKKEETEHEH